MHRWWFCPIIIKNELNLMPKFYNRKRWTGGIWTHDLSSLYSLSKMAPEKGEFNYSNPLGPPFLFACAAAPYCQAKFWNEACQGHNDFVIVISSCHSLYVKFRRWRWWYVVCSSNLLLVMILPKYSIKNKLNLIPLTSLFAKFQLKVFYPRGGITYRDL